MNKILFQNEKVTKVFHNAMYDVSWIRAMGLKINGRIYDTMIAASLINENRRSYTLDSLAREYAGVRKDETLLREAAKDWQVNAKSEMWRLPAMFVGKYAEQDADATLKLWQALKKELDKEELWQVFNLETDLFPCLVDMKFRGVRVDLEKAVETRKLLKKLLMGPKFAHWNNAEIGSHVNYYRKPNIYEKEFYMAMSFLHN